MAKSNSFFGLRRGSTKSLTFQILDGKQVTKDRVSVVANPKTSAQATQRQKLLPAVRFQAIFHDLIDHSWENVQYGQKSIQHFMKKALRANIINGMVKGQTGWVPNPYQISEGSLPSMGAYLEGNGPDMANVSVFNAAASLEALYSQGFQEGDQLTFIAVVEAGTNEQGIVYGMIYDRLILSAETTEVTSDGLVANTQNNLFRVEFFNDGFRMQNNRAFEGCALILSRRTSSKWLRSTEYLDTHAVDADIQRAIESYMQANVAKTSPWYLNAADNNVIDESDLNSGEWSPVMLARSASPGSDTTVYLGARNNLYGNYALVTADGSSTGEVYGAAVSSGSTLQQLTLASFSKITDSKGSTLDNADQRYAGAFGSSTLTAINAEQPDQFLAASVIGK